jgi:hypothetical protein
MSAIGFELKKARWAQESIPGTVTRNYSIIIETVSITGTNFGKRTRIEEQSKEAVTAAVIRNNNCP